MNRTWCTNNAGETIPKIGQVFKNFKENLKCTLNSVGFRFFRKLLFLGSPVRNSTLFETIGKLLFFLSYKLATNYHLITETF